MKHTIDKTEFSIPSSMRDYFIKRATWGIELLQINDIDIRNTLPSLLVDNIITNHNNNDIASNTESEYRKTVHSKIEIMTKTLKAKWSITKK